MVPREGFAEEAWMAGRSSHGNIWGRSYSNSGLASEQPGSAVWGLEKDLGGWRMNRWGSSKKMRLRRFGIARSFGDVWASLLAQMVKGSACNTGDPGSIPQAREDPWRRERLSTPVFLSGEFHRQRRLVGYSLWGWQRVGHNWATNTFILGTCRPHAELGLYPNWMGSLWRAYREVMYSGLELESDGVLHKMRRPVCGDCERLNWD